jgi:hypothetical protein
MREIKFRVWASDDANPNGRMYYRGDAIEPEVGGHKTEGVFLLSAHGDLIAARANQHLPEGTIWARVANNELEVMQYTGLIDDNVEEVYEGDVIFNEDRNENGIVAWSKEKAMFVTEYPQSEDAFPLWETLNNCYRVIGNIYEHPHLLTSQINK